MKKALNEFNQLNNDVDRFCWLRNNQHLNIVLYLDNDDTFAVHEDDDENKYIFQFDSYLGWSDGIFSLLEAVDIRCSSV